VDDQVQDYMDSFEKDLEEIEHGELDFDENLNWFKFF